MKRFDSTFLQQLSLEAAHTARRRKNYNLHPTPDDPIQRMLNAFEPGTYVRPHRHAAPPKWELFVLLSGRAVVLTFDDDGRVRERIGLDAAEGARVIEIPEGVWHTLVSLTPGTVLFEVKHGPFDPRAPAEFAAWAPAESDPLAVKFERWFQGAAPGDVPPPL